MKNKDTKKGKEPQCIQLWTIETLSAFLRLLLMAFLQLLTLLLRALPDSFAA